MPPERDAPRRPAVWCEPPELNPSSCTRSGDATAGAGTGPPIPRTYVCTHQGRRPAPSAVSASAPASALSRRAASRPGPSQVRHQVRAPTAAPRPCPRRGPSPWRPRTPDAAPRHRDTALVVVGHQLEIEDLGLPATGLAELLQLRLRGHARHQGTIDCPVPRLPVPPVIRSPCRPSSHGPCPPCSAVIQAIGSRPDSPSAAPTCPASPASSRAGSPGCWRCSVRQPANLLVVRAVPHDERHLDRLLVVDRHVTGEARVGRVRRRGAGRARAVVGPAAITAVVPVKSSASTTAVIAAHCVRVTRRGPPRVPPDRSPRSLRAHSAVQAAPGSGVSRALHVLREELVHALTSHCPR